MRRALMHISSVLLAPLAAGAQTVATPTDLLGTWGTPAECAGRLIAEGGTVRAAPVEISDRWLKQGSTVCQLLWLGAFPREGELFATARATCGEDSARSYKLDLILKGEDLHLFWNEEIANGPLHRCPRDE